MIHRMRRLRRLDATRRLRETRLSRSNLVYSGHGSTDVNEARWCRRNNLILYENNRSPITGGQ